MHKHKQKRTKKRAEMKYVNMYIPEHSELEKSNQRDIALLEHGWAPEQTKFGEPFKAKNKIMIGEEK